MEMRPVNPQWTFEKPYRNEVHGSRIDLCLANRAARDRVVSVEIRKRCGFGHSPLLIRVKGRMPVIHWFSGRRKLPDVLTKDGLCESREWAVILEKLKVTLWLRLEAGASSLGRADLAEGLDATLQKVVQLAGGWGDQPKKRRKAYSSPLTNKLRVEGEELRIAMVEVEDAPGWSLADEGHPSIAKAGHLRGRTNG
jgi:hypothetical protein